MENQESDAANELWRQHSEDEAAARKAQQTHAGQTHQPVEGPPPYGNEQVNLLAAEIVARERERCAMLVETWPAGPDVKPDELLRQLAAQLRRQP
jgi:hypothetical protein